MPVPIRILSVLLLATVSTSAIAAPKKAPPAPPAATAGSASLEPVLAGEFALQAGQLDEAARAYLDAAKAEAGDAGGPLGEAEVLQQQRDRQQEQSRSASESRSSCS